MTELDRLVDERLDLIGEQAKIKDRLNTIDQLILPLLRAAGGRHEPYPGMGVRLGSTRRLNAALLPTLLGADQYRAICVFPPSNRTDAAKVLPDELVDLAMVAGEPTVQALRGGPGGR